MKNLVRATRWMIGPVLLWAAACASTRPEPSEIQQAQLAVQDARDAGGESAAPEIFRAAVNDLSASRTAWTSGDEPSSLHYARLAYSESREAQAIANLAQAQQRLDSLRSRRSQLEAELRQTQARVDAARANAAARAEQEAIHAQQEQARLQQQIAAQEAARQAAEERERALRAQLETERQQAAEQQRQAEIDRLNAELESQKKAAEEARQTAERQRAELEAARQAEEARRVSAEEQAKSQMDLLVRLQQIEKSARAESRGIVVTLPGNIYFASGRSDLQPGVRAHLEEIGKTLATVPNHHVLVEGHTDSTGRADFNLKLSELRAESVKSVLVASGVSPDRVEVNGYGATKPLASNETANGRSQNRRVEIVIQAAPGS
jgi:outer membrane protein OmpA-like peptidoglycan-associated protein